MKRVIIAISCFLIPAAALAGEFEGTYELEYPDLSLAMNIGLIVGGQAVGMDWVLPLEHLPEDFFDELKAELFQMIDENPWIPPKDKEALKASIEELLAVVLDNWNGLVATVMADLPETAVVAQGGWPFEGVLGVTLDDDPVEWIGGVNLDTGEFGMLPYLGIFWDGVAPWGSTVVLHGILGDGEFHPEEDAMEGHFLNIGEIALVRPGAIAFAGLGVGGAFTGAREGATGGATAPQESLEEWLQRQDVWSRVQAETARELGIVLEAAPTGVAALR